MPFEVSQMLFITGMQTAWCQNYNQMRVPKDQFFLGSLMLSGLVEESGLLRESPFYASGLMLSQM